MQTSDLDIRSRIKVLFVTPYLPSPPRFGGQQRLHALASGLAKTHDVSVLSLVDPSEDVSEGLRATQAYCRRVVTIANRRYAANGARKRLLQLRSLLSPRSHEWLVHRVQPMQSALATLVEAEAYDVVQFEFAQMASCRPTRSATTRSAFCLDEHNIEYDIIRRTSAACASPLRMAYSAVDWRKLRADERAAWTAFDGCTLTSHRDQSLLLSDSPRTRTAIVPNGVDLEYFAAQPADLRDVPKSLLFFGAIDYFPNTDGLLFFLREVLPLLKSRYPTLRLTIVGRRPPEVITAYAGADVEVTGMVDDVRPYLARSTVVVVPLRIGGGTRLKILEAMAMRKAVVSTSVGVEGLDAVRERDVLVADDPEGFARQVGRLLDDPVLTDRIGEAAMRLVTARYGWGASVERLSAFYRELLKARRP